MANAFRSMKMRLVRAFKGCVADADKTFADDVANERAHNPPQAKLSNTPTRPVISGPLHSKSVADMLLPPKSVTTTAPVEIPSPPVEILPTPVEIPLPSTPVFTDIQVFVITTDGITTEADLLPYNEPWKIYPEDNLALLSPTAIWIPGKARQPRKPQLTKSERNKRRKQKMQKFNAILSTDSSTGNRYQLVARSAATETLAAASSVAFPTAAITEDESALLTKSEAVIGRSRVRTARPPPRLAAASA